MSKWIKYTGETERFRVEITQTFFESTESQIEVRLDPLEGSTETLQAKALCMTDSNILQSVMYRKSPDHEPVSFNVTPASKFNTEQVGLLTELQKGLSTIHNNEHKSATSEEVEAAFAKGKQ